MSSHYLCMDLTSPLSKLNFNFKNLVHVGQCRRGKEIDFLQVQNLLQSVRKIQYSHFFLDK